MKRRQCKSDGKKGSERKTNIQDFPDALLENILLRVEWKKRKHVSLVCRKWYELDRVSRRELCFDAGPQHSNAVPPKRLLPALVSRFSNLTFLEIICRDFRPHGEEQVDDDCLRCLSVECVKLTTLRLTSCKQVTDAGIANVAHCPELTAVYLLEMPRVSKTGLLSLLSRCQSLKNLKISGLNSVKGVEWLEFAGMHCQVESLGIYYCNGVKESNLVKLGRRGWRNLREFCYRRAFREDGYEPQFWGWRLFGLEETECCPNLEKLQLSNCLSMSRMDLLSILGQCTALRDVSFANCLGFGDEDIQVLTQNNPQLSSLCFTIDRYDLSQTVTNVSLVHIAENSRWLKTLLLTFTNGDFEPLVLESGLVAIVERCAQLEFLSLSYVPCIHERLMTAIVHSASLREVKICECNHLTDEMFLLMGSNLTSLTLIDCPLLTDECFMRFRSSPQVLAKLQIMGCPGITRKAAFELAGGSDFYYET